MAALWASYKFKAIQVTITPFNEYPTLIELAQHLVQGDADRSQQNDVRLSAALQTMRKGVEALGLALRQVGPPHIPIAGREPMEIEWIAGRLSRADAQRLFDEYLFPNGQGGIALAQPSASTEMSSARREALQEFVKYLERVEEMYATLVEARLGPVFLRDWLWHDTWTRDQGLALLAGVIPEAAPKVWDTEQMCRQMDERNPGRTRAVVFARELSGRPVSADGMMNALLFVHGTPSVSANVVTDLIGNRPLNNLSAQLERLEQFWDSGQHADRNPPQYFVEWAIDRDIPVPWLEDVRAWAAAGEKAAQRFVQRLDAASDSGVLRASPPSKTGASSADAVDEVQAGVPTGEIAHAFAGLRGWDEVAWKSALGSAGSKHPWLKACQVKPGSRGRNNPATWDPVKIAAHVVAEDSSTLRKVAELFEREDGAFAAWLDGWTRARIGAQAVIPPSSVFPPSTGV